MIISKEIGDVAETECAICCGNKPNIQIVPCKHNTFCSECIQHVRTCPMCRGPIDSIKILPGTLILCEDDETVEKQTILKNPNNTENIIYDIV